MAFVEVTKKDHIAVVTMNRPEALNALNKAVFTDLEVALDDVEKDDEVYVVIITGAGRAFIAGADIGEMAPMNVAEGLAFSELGNRILMRVDMMEKPTIAAVNGFAWAAAARWPWPATSASLPRRPSSASPRWVWASSPASAAPSVWPGSSAPAPPWS